MRMRAFAVAVLWALSLIGVSVWAQGRAPIGAPVGAVITGADIGFQPVQAGTGDFAAPPNTVVGRWVVRVNGEWRATAVSPMGSR